MNSQDKKSSMVSGKTPATEASSVRVYMDYAASTPVDPLVEEAMRPYWSDSFGNPGALHADGRQAKDAADKARATIAAGLGAKPRELIFTGTGTEANAIAIFGVLAAHERAGRKPEEMHVITSAIEHPSVRDGVRDLEREGYSVTVVPVTEEGIITPKSVTQALRPETVLVSLMLVNNEIGTIEPIAEIAQVIAEHKKQHEVPIALHTDASQAALCIAIDVNELGVDLLSIDAQKMYGPKGVGGLYIREGTLIGPVHKGGSQERGLRGGTLNIPGIVAFGRAWELADERREQDNLRFRELQHYFFDELARRIPHARVNGSREHRLPNNVNISIPGLSGEYVVIALDEAGISAATRSACIADGSEGSYVVDALGTGEANTSVRFSMGRQTTKEDIDTVVSTLEKIATR